MLNNRQKRKRHTRNRERAPEERALLAAALRQASVPAAVATGVSAAMIAVWVVVALLVHGAVGFTAYRLADTGSGDSPPERDKTEVEFVEVEMPEREEEEEQAEPEPPPEEEPAPEPLPEEEEAPDEEPPEEEAPEEEPPPEEETAETEPEQPPEEPKKARRTSKKAPKEAEQVDDPFAEFDDFGALDASTSDQGSIGVVTGSSTEGRIRNEKTGNRKHSRRPSEKDEGPAQRGTEDGTDDGEEEVRVVSRKKLDRKAEPNESYNRRIKANYPEELKNAGREADVIAILTVRPNGTVAKVRVVNKVDPEFKTAAIAAFKRFKFEPAVQDGKPVAAEVRLIYRFRLDDA